MGCYRISVILGNFRSDSDQEFINWFQLHKLSRVLYQLKHQKQTTKEKWNQPGIKRKFTTIHSYSDGHSKPGQYLEQAQNRNWPKWTQLTQKSMYLNLPLRNKKGWTGFSQAWQACSKGFLKGFPEMLLQQSEENNFNRFF